MRRSIPPWTIAAPLIGCLLIPAGTDGPLLVWLIGAVLVASVVAAVHHAETVAHRVGEPFGTLLLALAVTVIEAGLIVTLMQAGGPETATLARDTVFAAVMIILNLLIGAFLLLGSLRHGEQRFRQTGVSATLATIGAITILTLVLPNYTVSAPGPVYAPAQLGFVALVSLLLYLTFVRVQTVAHRDYFLPAGDEARQPAAHAAPPSVVVARRAAALLVLCLFAVVLLAKNLAPPIEDAVGAAGAPKALVGIIIAGLVLLPEGLAAIRAARANRLQTSLNLGLGSALATIGLTIPAVAVFALATGLPLALGLDGKGTVLLLLTLFTASLSLGTGRTTMLQGIIHLVIFAVYLFTTVVP